MDFLFFNLATLFIVAFVVFIVCFIAMPTILFIARMCGLYVIIEERHCLVYVLFGKVELVLSEPGIHSLLAFMGPKALLINWLGTVREVDLRLDQVYLRSQPVNSEEGAPMGIGIWYEMWINDPVAYIFKNADPRGSLRANVDNATVRNLSNMRLANMLEDRHVMSARVREEVSQKSREWGFALGTVYVRKVHFRDPKMIQQIEEKVVNRLRQVTSAIRQDGVNQVNLITSTAERQAAIEFAKAGAMRPNIVGAALSEIARDTEVAEVMFQILENQKMLEGRVEVTLIPPNLREDILTQVMAADVPASPGRSPGAAAPAITLPRAGQS